MSSKSRHASARRANSERRARYAVAPDLRPAQMAILTCPVCGKKCYRSKGEARRAARQIYGQAYRVYRCGELWHMTSQSAAAAERHREARQG
jgi:hypothetical protein